MATDPRSLPLKQGIGDLAGCAENRCALRRGQIAAPMVQAVGALCTRQRQPFAEDDDLNGVGLSKTREHVIGAKISECCRFINTGIHIGSEIFPLSLQLRAANATDAYGHHCYRCWIFPLKRTISESMCLVDSILPEAVRRKLSYRKQWYIEA